MQPELRVEPNIYTKSFPHFEKPRIIGFIGIENLKFVKHVLNKEVNFDLNLRLHEAKHKPRDLDVKLNELLQFLLQHETRLNFTKPNSLDKAPFFCYRGLMTCLACTPYEFHEGWKIVAVLFKGNIYLCSRDTEEKKSKNLNMSEREKRFESWGFKFEQFMLSDKPDSEPNPDMPVDETKEFSMVFKTKLNSNTIIFGAEMDGIRCDRGPVSQPPHSEEGIDAVLEYLSTKECIELKTNRHIQFSKQEQNFKRYKTKKWWCQSFLTGVDTVICGCRNDDGIVEELKVYHLRDLAKMSERFWTPNVCFNFLDTFLIYVKRCFSREIEIKHGRSALNNLQTLPLLSILFEWNPGMPVQVADNYNYKDDPILHDWFVDNFGKSNDNP